MIELTKKIEYGLTKDEYDDICNVKHILIHLGYLLNSKSYETSKCELVIDSNDSTFKFTQTSKQGLNTCIDLLDALENGEIYIERD